MIKTEMSVVAARPAARTELTCPFTKAWEASRSLWVMTLSSVRPAFAQVQRSIGGNERYVASISVQSSGGSSGDSRESQELYSSDHCALA